MGMDSWVEEFLNLQEQVNTTIQPVNRNPVQEENKDNMDINEEITLRDLYIDPVEKFMDEFTGTATELRGLFKIHASTAVDSNLQQIICSTARETFEKTEGKVHLFGLNFTIDEQISSWVNRTEETWKKISMPITVEGFMQVNDSKKQFNFFKSLEIANVNLEVENLHPSTHEFWENAEIKKELMNYLKDFSRNKMAYDKQTMQQVEVTTKEYLRGNYEELEVGFVDGLFELYKLRELIAKTKGEILSEGLTTTYKHKFGTSLFTSNITFRSTLIENIVLEKRLELDRQKKVEGSLLIYDYLILQHAALKCILERK